VGSIPPFPLAPFHRALAERRALLCFTWRRARSWHFIVCVGPPFYNINPPFSTFPKYGNGLIGYKATLYSQHKPCGLWAKSQERAACRLDGRESRVLSELGYCPKPRECDRAHSQIIGLVSREWGSP